MGDLWREVDCEFCDLTPAPKGEVQRTEPTLSCIGRSWFEKAINAELLIMAYY